MPLALTLTLNPSPKWGEGLQSGSPSPKKGEAGLWLSEEVVSLLKQQAGEDSL
ncbi:MAG: hypothetical protein HC769_35855 [Cyanobacteria bacterium CRU_2_1]|nr:hypothetical protein [Cyanobacteria bacterium CRU_2_1]